MNLSPMFTNLPPINQSTRNNDVYCSGFEDDSCSTLSCACSIDDVGTMKKLKKKQKTINFGQMYVKHVYCKNKA